MSKQRDGRESELISLIGESQFQRVINIAFRHAYLEADYIGLVRGTKWHKHCLKFRDAYVLKYFRKFKEDPDSKISTPSDEKLLEQIKEKYETHD